jgi:ATPase subunit of ABC transporter with duplicated ATPase domains
MITVQNLSKAYAGKKLFIDVNVGFPPLRRYGLTGPNGAGKTTFMKILIGEVDPDTGFVSKPERTGYLRQDHSQFESWRVVDVVISGNKRLWDAMAERDRLYAKGEKMTDADGMRAGELEGVVAEEDGYSAEASAGELLSGLGIESTLLEKKMSEIPTGSRVRVLLAQALFGNPQAMLLDEPTNNLDLDSIHWLEGWLNNYTGTLITISHDRHFLNEICTHIADIDYETIITYVGNYDDMVITKSQTRSKVESENSDKQKKIEQLQEFVARFSAGTRSSQVQSRKKAIEKLDPVTLKKSNISRPFIKFEQKRPSGKQTLTVENLKFSYDGKHWIVDDFSCLITRGERVAIIGPNGIGKTTLTDLLVGRVKPVEGKIVWGHEASIGLFPQDAREMIPLGTTCVDFLNSIDPKAGNEVTRGLLGRMLFSGEEGIKPTKALSGGEAVRLLMSKLMLEQNNVLVMDEPTNHLDLESISALTDGLKIFPGTVFIVAHDRNLISEVATRIFVMKPSADGKGVELLDFQGTYDEYLAKHEGDATAAARRKGG